MKMMSRLAVTGFAAAALTLSATGVASASESAAQDTPIWLVPGVDLGSLLGSTTSVPGALAPVFGLLTLLGA